MTEKEIMTAADLAKYLDFSKNWIYRKAEEGEIPGVKMGNRWRFKRSVIDRWMEGKVLGEGKAPGREQKKLRMTWAGALREFRDQFTSLELQKKALGWWGD